MGGTRINIGSVESSCAPSCLRWQIHPPQVSSAFAQERLNGVRDLSPGQGSPYIRSGQLGRSSGPHYPSGGPKQKVGERRVQVSRADSR